MKQNMIHTNYKITAINFLYLNPFQGASTIAGLSGRLTPTSRVRIPGPSGEFV